MNAKGHSLVDAKSTSPEAQGFDVVADFPNRNMEQNDPKSIYAITEKSLSFIEASRDRPFFLYLSHHSVHVRLEAREALVAKYTARDKTGLRQHNPVYAGMVRARPPHNERHADPAFVQGAFAMTQRRVVCRLGT